MLVMLRFVPTCTAQSLLGSMTGCAISAATTKGKLGEAERTQLSDMIRLSARLSKQLRFALFIWNTDHVDSVIGDKFAVLIFKLYVWHRVALPAGYSSVTVKASDVISAVS